MKQYNHVMLRQSFATYRIDSPIEPKKPLFIGCCKLNDLWMLEDAWTYRTFSETMKDARTPIRLTVLGIFVDEGEAKALQTACATVDNVWINLHDQRITVRGRKRGQIRDMDSGEIFDTASAVAKMLGVTAQSMSAHLAGVQKTVRGRKFERIDDG